MTDRQRHNLKNIILYILSNFSGGTDYIKLYKILYFANREHLAKVGVPITHDQFKAWDLGPVPSFTGSLVKHLEAMEALPADMSIFKGAIKVRKNKLIKAVEDPEKDSIPDYTKRVIDGFIKKYKYYNSKQLSQESHDDAWKEAYFDRGGKHNGWEVIDPIAMARCADADDAMIEFLMRLYGNDPQFINFKGNAHLEENLEDAAIEISELGDLPSNWDGEDSEAVDSLSAINCRNLISYKKAKVNYIEAIYPTPNGSICIDWKNKGGKLSVEINNNRMAYYFVSADRSDFYDSPFLEFGEASMNALFEDLKRLN